MAERDKEGRQRNPRSALHTRSEHVRETFSASVQRVGRLSDHMGEFSHRAAGILTRQDAQSVRTRLSLTALLVTVLALLITSVGNYYSLPHSPEEAADRFMGALQQGDYVKGLDEEAYSSFAHAYLTNTIYSSAENRVESYTVLGSTPGTDGQVNVAVRATIDGQDHELSLPFVMEPRTGLFNDTWKLAASTQNYLKVTSPVELTDIAVNHHTLELPVTRRTSSETGYAWVFPLLPGTYTVSLPETSYYVLSPAEYTVVSPLPGEGQVTAHLTLDIRPSPRMWRETDELIDSWLKRCESSRRLDTPGCPTSALHKKDSTATVSDVRWELISRPAFYLVQDPSDPTRWHASHYEQASMQLTYLADGKAQREIIKFTIDADVVSKGNQADISVGLGNKKTSKEELQEASSHDVASRSTLQRFASHS